MFFGKGQVPFTYNIVKVFESDIALRIIIFIFDTSGVLEIPAKDLQNYFNNDKNKIVTFNQIVEQFIQRLLKNHKPSNYMIKKYSKDINKQIDNCVNDLRLIISNKLCQNS